MKLLVRNQALFLEMFKHLVGRDAPMVISGKPETVHVLAVSTGECFGFEVEGTGGRRFVPVSNIWEITC